MSRARRSARSIRLPQDDMVNVRHEHPAPARLLSSPAAWWSLRTSWPRRGHSRWRGLLLGLASLGIAFALWQLLSTFVFNPFLIPPPVEVIRTAIPMLLSGEIFSDVAISMVRVIVGFVTGSLAGIVLGVLLGRIKTLHDLLDPIIELLRYLSPTAMIPIAVIWFGIGEMSKYFLIFWGTFFIVLINTTAGVWRAPIARQRAAECLGANRLQIFVLVVIPSAVPYIVTGMRVAMASSFMSIIPAEILAADSGIGYLLQKSSLLLQTNRIFVALLTICILGFAVDRLFRFAVDRVLARYMSYVALT
jgi:ABC-type nitrate/sulfonate/bicarbonate transport system permease component